MELEIPQSVVTTEDDDCNSECGEILLELEAAVGRDEDGKSTIHRWRSKIPFRNPSQPSSPKRRALAILAARVHVGRWMRADQS